MKRSLMCLDFWWGKFGGVCQHSTRQEKNVLIPLKGDLKAKLHIPPAFFFYKHSL